MNKSISTGIYSHLLKHAKVIPVYKMGHETHPCNYRPTSLLSIFNRLFEKLMYKRLRSYCEKNGIFFSSQYRFRDNCSTQHAILDRIVQKILHSPNRTNRSNRQASTRVPEYREIFLSVANEMQMADRKLYLADRPKNSLFAK